MSQSEKKQQKHDLVTHILIFSIFAIGLFAIDFLLDRIIEWAWLPVIGWLIAVLAHSVYYLRLK